MGIVMSRSIKKDNVVMDIYDMEIERLKGLSFDERQREWAKWQSPLFSVLSADRGRPNCPSMCKFNGYTPDHQYLIPIIKAVNLPNPSYGNNELITDDSLYIFAMIQREADRFLNREVPV